MTLTVDPRLPALVEIDEPNRQQARRITRKPTICRFCFLTLTADDLCFADGSDAHRHCAESYNAQLFGVWDELRAQDDTDAARERALDLGLALPKGGALWTPPSAHRPSETPAAAPAAV